MIVYPAKYRAFSHLYRNIRDKRVSCIVYTNRRITQSAPLGFNGNTYRASAVTAMMTMTIRGSDDGKQRSFSDMRSRIGSQEFIRVSYTHAKTNRPIAIAFMQIIWSSCYADINTRIFQNFAFQRGIDFISRRTPRLIHARLIKNSIRVFTI